MLANSEQDSWRNVGTLERLEKEGRFVVKLDRKQLLILGAENNIFAVNNRCPHEGYPLSEGTLQDKCVLACNWHGWTFDLLDGKALQGRDPLKTYPTEVRKGEIWVDLTPEPAASRRIAALSEFDEAFEEHDYNRMARAICRYVKADGSYDDIAKKLIKQSLNQLEYGFGHTHAGLADWFALAGDDQDLRLIALLEGAGHFSWDRLFSVPVSTPETVCSWDAQEFLSAIEDMDQNRALSLCNAAFNKGLGFEDLKPLFLRQLFSHYSGFGHPAIYVMKAEQLIEQFGEDIELTLSLQISRYLCLAAREDLIPEFRQFSAVLSADRKTASAPIDAPEVLSGKSVRQLLPLVDGAKSSNTEKWEALLAAAALDMLKFDLDRQDGIEQAVAQNIGWLDFTHAITFAEALYHHASSGPSLWRSGHLQQACFIGRSSKFLLDTPQSGFDVSDAKLFLSKQKAALFDMDVGEYLYSVHRLKLVVAVEKLLPLVGKVTQNLLLAALNRFLSTKMRHKHPARSAYQARAVVHRE